MPDDIHCCQVYGSLFGCDQENVQSVTKSFSKDVDKLEDTLYALNKNKITHEDGPQQSQVRAEGCRESSSI